MVIHTVRNLHFLFVQKFNFDFLKKCRFFVWKTCENVVVLDFLGVDKFDFTRKIAKKNWVKNSWKCWGLVKIEFLDENLTFRICNFPYFLTDKQKTKKSAGNSNYPSFYSQYHHFLHFLCFSLISKLYVEIIRHSRQ